MRASDLERPARLRSRTVAAYRFLELLEHDVAEGGGERVVVTIGLRDWVVVAARDPDGLWVLVRQHRHGVDDVTLEPAGGIIDAGEGPAEAAARELLEESGYEARGLQSLGWVHPNPALSSNRAFLYFAEAARVGDPASPADERTAISLLDDRELERALSEGQVSHALGVLALGRALDRVRGDRHAATLRAMEEHHATRVVSLAKRLRHDLTPDDLLSPHDFPELRDPDWTYEDGYLAGVRAARAAIAAESRRASGGTADGGDRGRSP